MFVLTVISDLNIFNVLSYNLVFAGYYIKY